MRIAELTKQWQASAAEAASLKFAMSELQESSQRARTEDAAKAAKSIDALKKAAEDAAEKSSEVLVLRASMRGLEDKLEVRQFNFFTTCHLYMRCADLQATCN